MERTKKYLGLTVLSFTVFGTLCLSILYGSKNISSLDHAAHGTNSYTLNFNSGTRLTEHSNIMYTASNYPVSFAYTGSLTSYTSGWQTLNGSVYNTTSISGMISLTATFSGSITISYGYKTGGEYYYIVSEPLTSGTPYTFDESGPSYFKLNSSASVDITSMVINYSCVDRNSVLEGWGRDNLGVVPTAAVSTVTYGLYPQKRISEGTIIGHLESSSAKNNGLYFYNGKYYLNRVASPKSNSYTFEDGTKIVKDTNYWFECQPIVWDVLSRIGNTYKLFSRACLDSQKFHHTISEETIDGIKYYAANYSNSDIRAYLNDVFYTRAFSINPSVVDTITLDNSQPKESDDYIQTPGLASTDRVYLLSYQELTSAEYGFDSNSARKRDYSDYAVSVGGNYSGIYYTRTATGSGKGYMYGDNYARVVSWDGEFEYGQFVSRINEICPGITITF